jgi:glycosyltransferase involved in cell wall biosynthesis
MQSLGTSKTMTKSTISYQSSTMHNSNLKIAIVHDWLIGGGAERVVLELHRMFPEAPIYTSYATKRWRQVLDNMVITGFLQRWPFSKLRKFIPFLRIWWFTHLDLSEYDLIISSTGAEAKGVKTRENQVHICYMHAPTHYYWSRYDAYLQQPGFPKGFNWLARFGLRLLVGPLRTWDFKAAKRLDIIIANSSYTAAAIKKYYKREAVIIHPPVDTERFAIPHEKHGVANIRKGYVITGRQTPYKRTDLAVQACTRLNVPLIVIGRGPDHARLKRLAGKNITFLRKVSDTELPHYLQSAEAFIFPGLDDFGIAPVEAMAAGTPVIAYKAGGALDYVVEGKTGRFFEKQTVESLVDAINNFSANKFDERTIRDKAAEFSPKHFRHNISQCIDEIIRSSDG